MQQVTSRRTKPARVIFQTLSRPSNRPPGATHVERCQVQVAMRQHKDAPERAVDHIVDRLLKELSW